MSIYDFQQSVEDRATVPLYYENRTPELHLENPKLNEDIYDIIESADLSEDAENRLAGELGRQYHILTRDDRLDTIARDIARHFMAREHKAMVVSIDKATAFRMYEKVRKYWKIECDKLGDQAKYLKDTDMAVIVSPGQNEVEQMKALGIDVVPHRKRMNDEELDEKFKDDNDPLRLVFVCAMWLTGFDVPSCSTIYLDKPMRNHSLMQTIARANRIYPGKESGLIVDYANVFASLEKALAIYAQGKDGMTPVKDKAVLVAELRKAMNSIISFCSGKNIDIGRIETLKGMDRLQAIDDAVDALIAPDETRKLLLSQFRLVRTLHQAIKPDPAAFEFSGKVALIQVIVNTILEETGEFDKPDISKVMASIGRLLDRSIGTDGFGIAEGAGHPLDLSAIDFKALAEKFKKTKNKRTEVERLKATIRAQLGRMIRLNKTRIDFLHKFEELIDSYNAGSRNIEQLYRDLIKLGQDLTAEEQRHIRENLSEEELTVFDILTRPGPNLTAAEQAEVKKAARRLLMKLKALLTLDWRKRTDARARVLLAIEDTLDEGLPRAYTKDVYKTKCTAVFEHLYESYSDGGTSVFTMVS